METKYRYSLVDAIKTFDVNGSTIILGYNVFDNISGNKKFISIFDMRAFASKNDCDFKIDDAGNIIMLGE